MVRLLVEFEYRMALGHFERAHILRVIEQCGGNKRKAAKLLGLGATSLYRKLDVSAPPDAEAEEPE